MTTPRATAIPSYAIFGKQVTPNTHALVKRFPLLDHVYANSEASIDGHYWTAAADVSDYVHRTGGRTTPAASCPTTRRSTRSPTPRPASSSTRPSEQGISWVNSARRSRRLCRCSRTTDRTTPRTPRVRSNRKFTQSDLGSLARRLLTTPFIGDGRPDHRSDVPRLYDSSKPAGARRALGVALRLLQDEVRGPGSADTLPAVQLHDTRRTTTPTAPPRAAHSPRAMVAENDYGAGADHRPDLAFEVWSSSAIFVDRGRLAGRLDHEDAHRIPAAVVSPYAKSGAWSAPATTCSP